MAWVDCSQLQTAEGLVEVWWGWQAAGERPTCSASGLALVLTVSTGARACRLACSGCGVVSNWYVVTHRGIRITGFRTTAPPTRHTPSTVPPPL